MTGALDLHLERDSSIDRVNDFSLFAEEWERSSGLFYIPDDPPSWPEESHDEFMLRLEEILSTALVPYTGPCGCQCHDLAVLGHHWGINVCCPDEGRKRA